MNPSLKTERLERERRLDPDRFSREYEAEFAEDLEAFLPSGWVENKIVSTRYQLPPCEGINYVAAVDPSGGGQDAFVNVDKGLEITRDRVEPPTRAELELGAFPMTMERGAATASRCQFGVLRLGKTCRQNLGFLGS